MAITVSGVRPAGAQVHPLPVYERRCPRWSAAQTAQAVPADAERAASPVPQLAGAWSWTDPAQCSETYEYRLDGSGSVQSGEERSEMAYVFDPKGSDTGFYKLEATILKDHGGTDCAGSKEDDTNRLYTVYVKFNPEGDQHIVCVAPEVKQCFGPLRRTGAVEIEQPKPIKTLTLMGAPDPGVGPRRRSTDASTCPSTNTATWWRIAPRSSNT